MFNLIALCPTCHALYTRGTITRDAIHSWKGVLVALNQAFDKESISNLLFLKRLADKGSDNLRITGDGVLQFSHLIGAGLADFQLMMQNGPMILYSVRLSAKGDAIVNAWFSGDRSAVATALGGS